MLHKRASRRCITDSTRWDWRTQTCDWPPLRSFIGLDLHELPPTMQSIADPRSNDSPPRTRDRRFSRTFGTRTQG
jgi:hypothetical protein